MLRAVGNVWFFCFLDSPEVTFMIVSWWWSLTYTLFLHRDVFGKPARAGIMVTRQHCCKTFWRRWIYPVNRKSSSQDDGYIFKKQNRLHKTIVFTRRSYPSPKRRWIYLEDDGYVSEYDFGDDGYIWRWWIYFGIDFIFLKTMDIVLSFTPVGWGYDAGAERFYSFYTPRSPGHFF